MDPYLEHPVLWEGVHARLIPAIGRVGRRGALPDAPFAENRRAGIEKCRVWKGAFE